MKLLDDVHGQQGPDLLLHDLIWREGREKKRDSEQSPDTPSESQTPMQTVTTNSPTVAFVFPTEHYEI